MEITQHVDKYSYKVTPSQSTGHSHATVKFYRPLVDHKERLFLQAVLGSDFKREILGYYKHLPHDEPITFFYEKEAPTA